MITTLDRAIEIYRMDMIECVAAGFTPEQVHRDTTEHIHHSFISEAICFDECSQEVAEAQAADLMEAFLTAISLPEQQTAGQRWADLRLVEFSTEVDTLRAAGEDEETVAAITVGSFCADTAERLNMDSEEVLRQILEMAAEYSAANPDPILEWLRGQMDESAL